MTTPRSAVVQIGRLNVKKGKERERGGEEKERGSIGAAESRVDLQETRLATDIYKSPGTTIGRSCTPIVASARVYSSRKSEARNVKKREKNRNGTRPSFVK